MKKQKIDLTINRFGIKSMIEIAEQLTEAEGNDINDINPTYMDMLITIYRKVTDENKGVLRQLFPNVTKELDKFL